MSSTRSVAVWLALVWGLCHMARVFVSVRAIRRRRVSGEPKANSLLTGKFTGNFAKIRRFAKNFSLRGVINWCRRSALASQPQRDFDVLLVTDDPA